MHSNFFSNARSTSTGIAAPPETHTCSEDVSAGSGWWSIAAYIVGTPSNTVARSRSMISSAVPASNRGSSDSEPPTAIVAFSAHVWPKAWNSGSAPSMTASGPSSNSSSETATFSVRFPWVSSAPLGCPVVPEV